MATISKGILGGFSGTVGTVVGASWRGKDIIRSKPKVSSRVASDKQLLQQAKFRLVSVFLQALKPIQNRYFGESQGAKSKANMAMSYTMREAVVQEGKTWGMLYNKVLITKGDLTGLMAPSLLAEANAVLSLSWEDNSDQGAASAEDYVAVVCYNAELRAFFIFEKAALRSALSCSVTLPAYMSGKTLEIWTYCSNAKENQASTSLYLGNKVIV